MADTLPNDEGSSNATAPSPYHPGHAVHLTPALLEEARRIELRMRRRVDATLMGRYRSAFRGSGLLFSDVREYEPGDDVKHIHWKVTARTGRTYVKSYEEERQLTIILVVDSSASTLTGVGRTRFSRQLEFAALIAVLAHSSQDRVGVCLFADQPHTFLPPSSGRQQLRRVVATLAAAPHGTKTTDVDRALQWIAEQEKRPAILFVVSDFYCPPFDQGLLLAARRHDVILTCIEDPLDRSLAAGGIVEFEDAESGQRFMIDTGSRAGSRALEEAHARRMGLLRSQASRCGADLLHIVDSFHQPLSALMRKREVRSRVR